MTEKEKLESLKGKEVGVCYNTGNTIVNIKGIFTLVSDTLAVEGSDGDISFYIMGPIKWCVEISNSQELPLIFIGQF